MSFVSFKPFKALAVAAVALGPVLGALAAAPAQAADEALTPAQEEAVRGLVRQYILDNPEIIAEAIDRLRSKQQAAAQEAQKEGHCSPRRYAELRPRQSSAG